MVFHFFLGGRKTYRDHLDEMRKLGSFLKLFKLLDLFKPQFPYLFFPIILVLRIKLDNESAQL